MTWSDVRSFWHLENCNSLLTVSLVCPHLPTSSPITVSRFLLLKCSSDHDICSKSPKASHPREIEVQVLVFTYEIPQDLVPISPQTSFAPVLPSCVHSIATVENPRFESPLSSFFITPVTQIHAWVTT